MELQVYQALIAAGAPEDAAKNAAESINRAIDSRYQVHSKQLATQGDVEKVRVEIEKIRAEIERVRAEVANTKGELIKWVMGLLVGQTALIIGVILKTLH
ncbi:hypothetical protein AGMMS49545_02050 [Betaproteobacteria bacterium]|nr:hypothetical protein AGMMS49545_02050 [Betaproteobacteria bacterium]GHU43868.1 hypothetical protein AGMMS50289_11060 [Betaproteobacteria bacterium]